jgi:hypothetical protein
LRIIELADKRQPKPEESVDQAVLGGLETPPAQQVIGRSEIRDRSVVAAGPAERRPAVRWHQPVAGVVPGIGAELEQGLGSGERAPAPAIRPGQRTQHRGFRQITQDVSAALAPRVFEVQQLTAILAFEELHESPSAS